VSRAAQHNRTTAITWDRRSSPSCRTMRVRQSGPVPLLKAWRGPHSPCRLLVPQHCQGLLDPPHARLGLRALDSEHVLPLAAAGQAVVGGAGDRVASRARATSAGPATTWGSASIAARRTILRVTSRPAAAQHLRDLARLRRVRDRIDREYAQPLDVEALARGAHMSAGHLSREFRLAYGESPYSYLMTRRIERAMALLRRGGLSVTEVCFAVGC